MTDYFVERTVETHFNASLLEPKDYCHNLRSIKHLPKKLYFLGNKLIFKEKYFLAVVGTRRATHYGRRALRHILPEIVQKKIVIVSGLAKGIDILAHETALEYNCPTIAVLAGGLDQVYPPEHKKIAKEMVDKGNIIISENPPGTQYLRQYFPARNRIISGISDATLVIEAGIKSGALITANFAFSQGRKVLALPGSIFSEQSQGVNGLFKRGALPAQSPEDILEALFGRRSRSKRVETPQCGVSTKNGISFTPEENKILEYISYDKPIPINFIIRQSDFSAAKAIAILTQMEIKGLVELVDGGYIKPG